MRFHMGISFRLKTLKKFLIPFLIGLLTYFGFSSFNILKVHAYNSNSSYYEFQYDEIDFSNIQTNGDYTFKDILDITQIPSEYYYIYSVIIREYNSNIQNFQYGLKIYLIPKENQFINGQFYGFINSNNNNSIDMYHAFNNINNQRVYYYTTLGSTINTSYSTQQFNDIYSALSDCLTSNNCTSGLLAYSNDTANFYLDSFTGSISNGQSYTINYKNLLFDNFYYERRFMPYYKNITIKNYNQVSTTPTYIYKKLIKINDSVISSLSDMPTYCDFYSCESSNPVSDFVSYLPKLPLFFTNTTDLSTYSFDFSYNVSAFIEPTEYVDNLYTYMFYYGRVNYNGYYTYEELNCSRSATGTIDDNTITENVSNISCTNDLTRYDKFFITYYNTYTDNGNWLNAIYNLSYQVDSNSNIVYSLDKSGNLYDNFDNLSRGFKVLLSNKHETLGGYVFVDSSNDYVAFDFVSNVSGNMDLTTNGDWYKNIPEPKKFDFGYDIGKNLLIYDDISYSTDSTTNLGLYLTGNTMVSFPVSDSYYYYDSTGTITQSTIILTYDTIDKSNNYDLSGIFNQINSFINSLNNDLFSLHTILDSIYSSIPLFIQSFIFIIYTLFLVYLLFRFIRK